MVSGCEFMGFPVALFQCCCLPATASGGLRAGATFRTAEATAAAFAEQPDGAMHDLFQPERLDGLLADVLDCFIHRVGHIDLVKVFWADGTHASHLLDEA